MVHQSKVYIQVKSMLLLWIYGEFLNNVKSCNTKKSKCNNCKKMCHYEQVCRSKKASKLELDDLEQEILQVHTENDYDADILKIDLL